MAVDTLKFCIVFMLLLSDASGYTADDFPLNNCHTGQFDILVMSNIKFVSENEVVYPLDWTEYITSAWTQYGNTDSRVLVNEVKDIWNPYSDSNECRVLMTKYGGDEINICDNMTEILPINCNDRSVQLEIQTKIKVAENIFMNMSVGRENTTHLAIIIVYALLFPSLTAEEIKRIPSILREENSHLKVVVIVYDFNTQAVPTLLPGTVVASRDFLYYQHLASMSLCNFCLPGWFPFGIEKSNVFFSCYKLDFASVKIDYYEARERCNVQGAHLAAVESSKELNFLQFTLFSNLLSNINHSIESHDYSSDVYIGLSRDSSTTVSRFQWTLKNPTQNRPLVINHWLPDNPNGGINHACGVWSYNDLFKYNTTVGKTPNNASTNWSVFSDYMSSNSEGWSSVGCGMKLSKVSLCEITLSRFIKNQRVFRIEPSRKESFYKTSRKSDFIEFEGKMVSVSTYANNETFMKFLKEKQEDFPLFDCADDATAPRHIAYSFVCDFTNHCSNGRDERVCSVEPGDSCLWSSRTSEVSCDIFKDCFNGRNENNCEFCGGRRCCDGTCLPAHLFNDGEIDCSDCKTWDKKVINDESSFSEESLQRNETCAFSCKRWQCVYPSQLYDSKVDCIGTEGPLDETIGKLERAKPCFDKLGRPFWAPKCVYIRDRYGSVLGCRDLSHLQNCSNFPCQEGYYKCPGSYCIPLHYGQDGKEDCPSGEDEDDIISSTCVGNFACWNSKVCLHPDLVCDGYTHCPYKDDELNCEVYCPTGLRCIADTVTVGKNNSLTQLNSLKIIDPGTSYLDLSGIDLSNLTGEYKSHFFNVYYLRVSRCKVTDVYSLFYTLFCCLNTTHTIDMSFNLITSFFRRKYYNNVHYSLRTLNLSFNEYLVAFADQKFNSLVNLDLAHTGISYLSEGSFAVLPNLKYLNLSFTKIFNFRKDIFPSGYTLGILDLRGAPIVTFYENTFNDLRITSYLYANNFGLCCPQIRGKNIPGDMCHASVNPISSCFDLIDVAVQRYLLWLVAGIALLGNIIVILFRVIWDRPVLKKAYGLFVLNLGISDLIMGLYLLVIATADVYYRGVYVLYDNDWRESVVCKVAGFLATLSNETSTFFIFLITVDRYLTLTFPYGQNQLTTVTTSVVIILTWGIGFLLALIPVLPIFGADSVFSATAMCNGLHLTNKRVNGWGYSLGVFIIFNCVMFVAIALGQMVIFHSISANRMSVDFNNQNSLRRLQDITVAKQLSLVVLSNFLCWFPVGLVGFLSICGHESNIEVYAWTVVLILPVNSAFNPVLYTIPVLTARWKKFKYGNIKHR